MPTREADAIWEGPIGSGKGTMRFGSGAFEGAYSVPSRFEDGDGTNPEELIAAAHAGCFSMFLSGVLTRAGFEPNTISTRAEVTIEKIGEGWEITRSHLVTEVDAPGIDDGQLQEMAATAKTGCPVSKALAGPEITLEASLVS